MPAQHIQANSTDQGYSNIVTNSNVHIGGAGNPAQELQVTGDVVCYRQYHCILFFRHKFER